MMSHTPLHRLLLYTVGDNKFASPLDELREVIDTPRATSTSKERTPVFHGEKVEVRRLAKILAERSSTDESDLRVKPLLVLETVTGCVGMEADTVHGMISADRLFPVPQDMTLLPMGCIMGAILASTRVKPVRSGSDTHLAVEASLSVDEWIAEDEESESESEAKDPGEIVLVLDLRAIAELAGTGEGGV